MLVLLKEVLLKAKKALTTLSGVLINFTLQKPQKAKKLVLTYLPQQDLNGYSKPWLGGNGRNILEYKGTPSAASGITASITTDSNGNKHYTLNGTKTVGASNVFFNLNYTSSSDVNIPTGNWIISCDNANVYLRVYQDGTKVAETSPGGSASFSITAGATYSYCRVQIPNDSTHNFSNEEINVMIRAANDPNTTYEPYSNICAITGRSNDYVNISKKNMLYSTLERMQTLNTSGTWSGNVYSYRGIDFTVYTNEKGAVTKIHSQGTASGNAQCVPGYYDFRNGVSVILNGCPAGGSGSTYRMYVSDTGATGYDMGTGRTITPTADVRGSVRIQIVSGQTVNLDWYPMIRRGDVTDATFEAYDGEVLYSNYGTTKYGGDYDLVTGKWAIYYKSVDLGSINWTRQSTNIAGKYRFRYQLDEAVGSIAPNITAYCNAFPCIESTYNATESGFVVNTNGSPTYLQVYSEKDCTLSATDFKTAMSGVIVMYRTIDPEIQDKTAFDFTMAAGEKNIGVRRADNMTVVYESEE